MKVRFPLWALCVFVAAGLLTGCGILSKAPPAVASVTLTDQVEERTKAPLRSLTAFPNQSTQFFASVKIANPRKGTQVQARWYFKNLLVDEADVTFQATGDRHVAFHLVAAGKPFPAGPYRVEIYLDGQKARELQFAVE